MSLEAVMSRVKNIFGTGMVTRCSTKVAQVKMATGIISDRIKRVHNYGFMSRPLPGAKAYTLFVGGDVSRGIAVLIEDERHEIELEPGEVAMLDDKGNFIHFSNKGITIVSPKVIDITCKTAKITADKTTVNGDAEVNGNTVINGDATITGICAVGSLAAVGGGAVPASGGMDITGGDIVVDGISVKLHKHKDAESRPTTVPL